MFGTRGFSREHLFAMKTGLLRCGIAARREIHPRGFSLLHPEKDGFGCFTCSRRSCGLAATAAGQKPTGTEGEQGEAAWLRHRRKFGLHTGNRGECRAGDARIVKDQASEFHRVARRTTIESVRFQPAVRSRTTVYSTIRKRNSIQVTYILRRCSRRHPHFTNPPWDESGEREKHTPKLGSISHTSPGAPK